MKPLQLVLYKIDWTTFSKLPVHLLNNLQRGKKLLQEPSISKLLTEGCNRFHLQEY